MKRVAKQGKKEVSVCVLGGGIHFKENFNLKQNPKYLGTIGKIIYEHFTSRKFKVSFDDWRDGMRMDELESDGGYKIFISW